MRAACSPRAWASRLSTGAVCTSNPRRAQLLLLADVVASVTTTRHSVAYLNLPPPWHAVVRSCSLTDLLSLPPLMDELAAPPQPPAEPAPPAASQPNG